MTDTRLIPRGMFVALGLLFLSYSLFTVASTNLVGIQHLCQNVGTDNVICSNVPQMLLGWQALGQVGALWMLLATLLTGVMTFNGGFATASRFMYAAAREATLPPFFARLSYARVVPWAAVVSLAAASAVIAVVVALTQSFNALILVGAVLEAMIYAVAGLCVLVSAPPPVGYPALVSHSAWPRHSRRDYRDLLAARGDRGGNADAGHGSAARNYCSPCRWPSRRRSSCSRSCTYNIMCHD